MTMVFFMMVQVSMTEKDVVFRTNVSQLDALGKEWFAEVVIGGVLADGQIDRSETNFLLTVIKLLDNKYTVERLKKFILNHVVPPLSRPKSVDKKNGMAVVVDLVCLSAADKEFHPKEKAHIFNVGIALGFKREEVKKLIAYGLQLSKEKAKHK